MPTSDLLRVELFLIYQAWVAFHGDQWRITDARLMLPFRYQQAVEDLAQEADSSTIVLHHGMRFTVVRHTTL